MKTAEDVINDKDRDVIWIDSKRSISDGIRKMVEFDIGVILVKENNEYVGIFSERDLLLNSVVPEFNAKVARIGDYMTTPLYTRPHDTPLIKLKETLLGLFVRHIVITKNDHVIGLLSIGDILRASLLEQDERMKELNVITHWEYYDDWVKHRNKRPKKR